MALSAEDKSEIVLIITNTLKGGCLCGLKQETTQEVGHFFARLKDLGGGNLNRGIECFSDAVEMVAGVREFGAKVGGAVAVAICLALDGGAGTLLVLGIRAWIKKVGG